MRSRGSKISREGGRALRVIGVLIVPGSASCLLFFQSEVNHEFGSVRHGSRQTKPAAEMTDANGLENLGRGKVHFRRSGFGNRAPVNAIW